MTRPLPRRHSTRNWPPSKGVHSWQRNRCGLSSLKRSADGRPPSMGWWCAVNFRRPGLSVLSSIPVSCAQPAPQSAALGPCNCRSKWPNSFRPQHSARVCARCCGSDLRGWPRSPAGSPAGPGLKFEGPLAAGVGASTRRGLAAWGRPAWLADFQWPSKMACSSMLRGAVSREAGW